MKIIYKNFHLFIILLCILFILIFKNINKIFKTKNEIYK